MSQVTAMRIKTALSSMLLMMAWFASAQNKELFTINPGKTVAEAIPDSAQYAYPSFAPGTISFRDGRSGTARLNYNYLFEEMMFLNSKGDTLAIDNAATIRQIVILADTFYFSHGFVKQIARYGDIKLASSASFRVIDSRKIGAMGQPTSNTVKTFNAASSASDLRSLVVQEVITLEKAPQFYLGDKFNNFRLANQDNLLDFFPGKRKMIKAYVKENNINFTIQEDIIKMLVYLQGIDQLQGQ